MVETDYAVPPGSWFEEWMEDTDTSYQRASEMLGWTGSGAVEDFIAGMVAVDEVLAERLASITPIPMGTWQRYEALYRADLERLSAMPETDYAVPPGEFLEEWIEDEEASVFRTAEALGWDVNTVEEFIEGRILMTNKRALDLWTVTKIPINTWLKYESLYHQDLERLRKNKAEEADAG